MACAWGGSSEPPNVDAKASFQEAAQWTASHGASAGGGPVSELLVGLSQQHELLRSQQRRLAAVNEEVAKVVWASQTYLGDLIQSLKGMDGSQVPGRDRGLASGTLDPSAPSLLAVVASRDGVPSPPSPLASRRSFVAPPLVVSTALVSDSRKLPSPRSNPAAQEPLPAGSQVCPTQYDGELVSCPSSPSLSPSMVSDGPSSRHSPDNDLASFLANKQDAILRLQARFGFTSLRGKVTAEDIHRSLVGLGFEKYSVSELNALLVALKEERLSFCESMDSTDTSTTLPGNTYGRVARIWRLCHKNAVRSRLKDLHASPREKIRFMIFARLLLADDTSQSLDPAFRDCFYSIKEILLSGASNRLVAELTQVRLDDLASPLPKADLGMRMEPYVAVAITINGIVIGIQASVDEQEDWLVWYLVNLCFTVFFSAEIVVRWRILGTRAFACGQEIVWNWFDGIIVLLAIIDSGFELYAILFTQGQVEGAGAMTVLRLIRLSRLSRLLRLFRIFRLTVMKELSVMVKGLLAGLKTLVCAMVLLFFTIYVFAVLGTSMLSPNKVPIIEEQHHFKTVFHSMFTVYRCLTSDCTTREGEPMTKLLEEAYGWPFVTGYLAFSLFVTFGIINLILAIYIESTLGAARLTEERDKVQRKREALRVAQHTKELLKKFCAAQRMAEVLITPEHVTDQEVSRLLQFASSEDVEELDLKITRQVFLVALQDPSVHHHMDQLDLPPDRLNMFDILDADGSGSLEVRELITGLLRVRGEARKSDAVAALLAIRAVQDMIRQLEAKVCDRLGERPPLRPPLLPSSGQAEKSQAGGLVELSI